MKEKEKIRGKGLFFAKSKKFHVLLNIILIIIIAITTIMIIIYHVEKYRYNSDITITHDKIGSYKYTNPILDCESNNFTSNGFAVSENEISDKVKEIQDKYGLDNISLYFRDLNAIRINSIQSKKKNFWSHFLKFFLK